MKIIFLTDQCFVTNDTAIVGGWVKSLCLMLQQSKRIKLAIIGLTNNTPSFTEQRNNVTFYHINKRISINPLKRIYQRWICQIEDKQIVNEYVHAIQDYRPDIVYIFGTEIFLCSTLPSLSCPAIVHLQGILNPYLNMWFPPGVSTSNFFRHAFHLYDAIRGEDQRQILKIAKARAQRELKYFDNICTVFGRTDWDRSIAQFFAPQAQYFHVEEVLRAEFYSSSVWRIQHRDCLHLLSVLSPSSYKGFDVILKTATLLKMRGIDFQWKVVGASECDIAVATLQKILKKKYAANNIIFLGQQPVDALTALLLDADLFVHPSYIDNSPNSVCEAQLLGLPVVASYVGGIPSLIKQNETGILFPANDCYLLAQIIINLIYDPAKREQLGKQARAVALKRHDRQTILESIENACQQILQV
jgi:glycosyltransferase involved in cell wall biosynthesis